MENFKTVEVSLINMSDVEKESEPDGVISLEGIISSHLNYENLKTVLDYMLGLIKTQNFDIGELNRREHFTTHDINMLVINNDEVLELRRSSDGAIGRIIDLEK